MAYIYSSNTNVTNSVEIQNELGNAISTNSTIYYNGIPVSPNNQLPVSLGSNTITITGNISLLDVVTVNSTPTNPVHVHITEVGNSGLLETANIKYLPIGGNVISFMYNSSGIAVTNTTPLPVSGYVIVEEDAGSLYSFNNHATNTNRGWTMDDTMRPVVSFRNNSDSVADLIKIIEYEIGNNNANQSTIIYEWYDGDIAITGAAVPNWTTIGTHTQYRVYQDKYSSNQGNAFTPNGAVMRHSGVIIGKNTSGDEGPTSMYGGNSRNMLTLCMRRVDSATKLDVWFAFTIKELI
jgi:hypothetical protein